MKFKKIISMILCCVMLMSLSVVDVFAVRYWSSGEVGSLLDNGTLTISGEGKMGDCSSYFPQPWLTSNDSIHTVIIEDGVTYIGIGCFKYLRNLKNVTIGKDVKEIRTDAFLGCENLENITWNAVEVEDFANNNTIFSECGISANGITVTFGENVKYIPKNLFSCSGASANNPKIKKVVFNGPVEIGYYAFTWCKDLEVHISSIEDWCKNKYYSVDANPLHNGGSLYLNGTIIKDLKTPNSLKEINETGFLGCTSIETVTIKDGLTKIGEYAFTDCSNIKKIYLPKSLTSIGRYAFDLGSRGDLDIYYAGTEDEWNAISKNNYLDTDFINLTMHYNEIYEKKDFEGITFQNKEYTYDGTEKAITVSGTLPTGATVTYESVDTTENTATDAGTYDVTATVTALGYYDLVLNATLTINKKDLTVSGLVANNKPYDATTNADIDTTGGSLVGVISGDDVTPTFPTTGTFASVNAGSDIAVSFSPVTISGADIDNYNLIQPTGLKANITKLPIKIKADDKQILKGDVLPELTYTISEDTENNFVGDDKESGTLATNANVNTLGEYDITQGDLTVPENYELIFTNGTLYVVDKTPQNITVDNLPTITYGDAGFDFSLLVHKDTTSNREEFTYASSNENVATVDAETGIVTIKGAGETEISVTEAGDETYARTTVKKTLTVAKAPLNIKLDNISITYGEPMPEYTITYTGFIGEENKSVLTAEPQVNGMPKKVNAGEYDLTLSDAEAANYEITYSYENVQENAKLTVAKKTLSVATMNVFDKAADETTTATINTSSITFTGLVSGDDVKVDTSVATATFDDATVGDNKAVSISNIAIIGNDANNYELSDTTFATTGNIKDSITATDIATQISAPLVEKNAETLTLPEVPEGYEIVIKSSDDEALIGLDGKVAPTTEDKTVNLVFTIKNTADETDVADTVELTVTIPTSDKVNVTVAAEVNGTVTGSGEYPKNSEVTVTATADSGYNFSGWYNGETSVSTSASYTFKATDDISLVAKFTKKTSSGGGGGGVSSYTVKFDTDGGNEIKSVKVSRNKTVAEPTTPTKDGYTFDGWYTDKNLTTAYDFDTKVTKSFTLYAKWVENKADTDNTDDTKPEDTTPVETKNPFADVNTADWFYNAVMFAYENNITSGISETEFAPQGKVTRGQFITMLCRAYDIPEMTGDNFDDCGDTWYTGYLAAAKQLGISNGVGDNKFAPEKEITREEMVTLIYNYLKSVGKVDETANETSFADDEMISEWAKSAVAFASSNGYVNGKDNNMFDPQGTATRAELAQIFYNILAK